MFQQAPMLPIFDVRCVHQPNPCLQVSRHDQDVEMHIIIAVVNKLM